jgi:hypothetical protein
MKSRVIHALATGLLLSGASLIQAQTPSHLIRIFREDIKEGKGAAHERVESAYARTFAKSAYPNYIGYENITGTSQAWFVERYATYADMEKAIQLSEKEPLKSLLAPLDAQDGDLRSGGREIIATYHPELSYEPVPAVPGKSRYTTVNIVRIHQGHPEEFAEMRKLVNAVFAKSGSKRRYVVYQVNSGMPAGTYLISSVMQSLKEMDPEPGAMSMVDAFGASYTRYEKLLSEIYISSETTLFAVNPKMSNPPKEFIAADPAFWTPKPAPTAAAAKTAGKTGTQQ